MPRRTKAHVIGGPLADSPGRLLGIDSLAAAAGSAEDVGFAIDARQAEPLLAAVRARIKHG
jgi:S1-C subfamily serine protease